MVIAAENKTRKSTVRGKVTRQKLLESSIQLLASTGYAATTTQAIIDNAGVSRGSLLHQFGTRQEMILATAESALMLMYENVSSHLKAFEDPIDSLMNFPNTIWTAQNKNAARALVEIQLASRWEKGLAQQLRKINTRNTNMIVSELIEFADGVNMSDVDGFISVVSVVIDSTQSMAIRLPTEEDQNRLKTKLDLIANFLSLIHI